jgi:hypothetical protein
MTDKQFNEQKKMLEDIKQEISSLFKNLVEVFNIVNKTAHYVGSTGTVTNEDKMLEKILEATFDNYDSLEKILKATTKK